jgi:hypothetical protein
MKKKISLLLSMLLPLLVLPASAGELPPSFEENLG